jgi:hypothetical protein
VAGTRRLAPAVAAAVATAVARRRAAWAETLNETSVSVLIDKQQSFAAKTKKTKRETTQQVKAETTSAHLGA